MKIFHLILFTLIVSISIQNSFDNVNAISIPNGIVIKQDDDQCIVPCDRIIELLPKDAIPAINDPIYTNADGIESNNHLKETSKVLGVLINDMAYAYPYNILSYHEIVNDHIAGTDLAITYCPLTGSGITFHQLPSNSFGVSGRLYENNLVMYDLDSESYWSQMLLQSVKGSHNGESLEPVLTIETTWRAWQSMYPNTQVLDRASGIYTSSTYDNNPYLGYDRSISIRFDTSYLQYKSPFDLYDPKEETMIITIGNETLLLPFVEISSYSIINEVLSDVPIVIVTDPFNDLSLAYSRKLPDGTILESFSLGDFEIYDDSEIFGLPVFTDSSGTVWNFKGEAIEGQYHGLNLDQLYSYNAYWFAAIVFHPEGKIFPQDSTFDPVKNSIDLFNNRPGEKISGSKKLLFKTHLFGSLSILIMMYINRKKKQY